MISPPTGVASKDFCCNGVKSVCIFFPIYLNKFNLFINSADKGLVYIRTVKKTPPPLKSEVTSSFFSCLTKGQLLRCLVWFTFGHVGQHNQSQTVLTTKQLHMSYWWFSCTRKLLRPARLGNEHTLPPRTTTALTLHITRSNATTKMSCDCKF